MKKLFSILPSTHNVIIYSHEDPQDDLINERPRILARVDAYAENPAAPNELTNIGSLHMSRTQARELYKTLKDFFEQNIY